MSVRSYLDLTGRMPPSLWALWEGRMSQHPGRGLFPSFSSLPTAFQHSSRLGSTLPKVGEHNNLVAKESVVRRKLPACDRHKPQAGTFRRLCRASIGLAATFTICCLCHLRVQAQPAPQSPTESPSTLAGFSDSETYDLEAASPLDLKESLLVRTLYRVAKVSPQSMGEYSRFSDTTEIESILQTPREYRFWAFTRPVRLKRLSVLKLPGQQEVGGIKGVYLATCESPDGTPLFLLCRSAPRLLPLNQLLNEKIRFAGFFYNSVATIQGSHGLEIQIASDGQASDENQSVEESPAAPLMIVKRFAWYPQDSSATPDVSAGQAELATYGVDIGLFDFVKEQNSKRLSKYDASCFYQMLGAAKLAGLETVAEDAAKDRKFSSFVDLMREPNSHFGSLVKITGSLRQCVRVNVPAQQVNQTNGLKEYWQVSLFPDLGGRPVVIKSGKDENLEFSRYPVTVCLSKLPAGLSAQTMSGKTATVEGFFYRFVRYQSQKSEAAGKDGMVSPLVMASGISIVSTQQSASALDSLLRLAALMLLLAIGAAIAWRVISWRREFSKTSQKASAFELPDSIDISNIDDQNLS